MRFAKFGLGSAREKSGSRTWAPSPFLRADSLRDAPTRKRLRRPRGLSWLLLPPPNSGAPLRLVLQWRDLALTLAGGRRRSAGFALAERSTSSLPFLPATAAAAGAGGGGGAEPGRSPGGSGGGRCGR